jgi:O-antigen/teichoic acid export membrane protein
MDLIKFIIQRSYWVGLDVVPIILFSFIFQGIFFNLSIWYKLTDKNHYGAWFSAIGTVIIFVGNIVLVPRYSYWGSAWSAFAGYLIVMLLSYFYGQKFMPINYQLKKLGGYLLLTMVLFAASWFIETPYLIVNLLLKTILLAIFIFYAVKKDFPLEQIPVINKWVGKK